MDKQDKTAQAQAEKDTELKKRLEALASDGIVLPLGKVASTGATRL